MRPHWDDYFMAIAYVAATRATCDRKHVGCLLVSPDKHILASGYNGSPPGKDHCDDVGHELIDGHCVRTTHAEANAIAQAARAGTCVSGAKAYVTTIPCYDCAKLLITAGINSVVFHGFYQSRYDKSDKVTQFFHDAGIPVKRLEDFHLPVVTSAVQVG